MNILFTSKQPAKSKKWTSESEVWTREKRLELLVAGGIWHAVEQTFDCGFFVFLVNMFFLSLCHFYLLFKNYISWSLELQDLQKHPVENPRKNWQSDKKSPAFRKEFCYFGISCVRDTIILEVEIDETSKEDMGYGVKTNYIPKGYEGDRLFDGWRYVLNTWRFFKYVLENILGWINKRVVWGQRVHGCHFFVALSLLSIV